jgi:hypothetical protein
MRHEYYFIDYYTGDKIRGIFVNGDVTFQNGDEVLIDGVDYCVAVNRFEFLEGKEVKHIVKLVRIDSDSSKD